MFKTLPSKLFLLAISLLVVFLGFYIKQYILPSISNSTAETNIEDWKTYEDNRVRFSFKYPSDLVIEEWSDNYVLFYRDVELSENTAYNGEYEDKHLRFSVYTIDNPERLSSDEIFKKQCREIECPESIANECRTNCLTGYEQDKEVLNINGYDVIKWKAPVYEGDNDQVVFSFNDKVVIFRLSELELGSGPSAKGLETFNKIYATFRKN